MLSRYIKGVVIILFLLFIIPEHVYVPQDSAASSRLPIVSSEMERPEFWLNKIKNPTNSLLTPEEVEKMNEENLRKKDLYLCRIKGLSEDWTREEILSFLNEDWENYGKTGEVGYGRGEPSFGESFAKELRNELNQKSIKESNRMLFGLVAKRTDIRVFPTDEPSPRSDGFDRFQQSSISPGSPIGIYHLSQDRGWAYVQTQMIRGWVRTDHLAIAKEKSEVAEYEAAKDRLVVTGNFIHVFSDPSFQQSLFLSQMGDSFPLVGIQDEMKMGNRFYIISTPWREGDGQLTFRKGYIRRDEDVHRGFLSYTQSNLAHQAFKMLDHPYGWGDRLGGRDCSRFIMDLFRTFGILMPRNSREQARVGVDLGGVKGNSSREKRKVLDQAIPLATTLRLPGHIMLYLGRDKGKHYVIHSLWGIQGSGKVETIGKVVVSDLTLGSNGPNGSLLDRITGMRAIGLSHQIQKEK
ncbi:MAG: C40 family peptidase [Thermodesulfobacteriota bacterium]